MKPHLHIVLVALLTIAAAGCSPDTITAPSALGVLSPATQSGLSAVAVALDAPAWRSLDVIGRGVGPAPLAAGVRPMLRDAFMQSPALATRELSSRVREAALELSQRTVSPLAAVIPPEVRGTTYVFDPGQNRYVADPARTGAPATGVRYILYALNPLTHEPVVSEEIGYADLTDEGDDSPNAVALRLRAVSGGITFVDYRVSLARAAQAGELAVEGAFFDGRKHLEFAIRAHGEHGEDQETLTVRFRLAVPEDGFALANEAQAVATAADNTLRMNQAVAIGDDAFAIASVHQADRLDATVAVNGVPFAQIHADAGSLTVLGIDGRPLPPDQRLAFARLMGLFEHVSRLLEHLLAPVGALFALVPTI